MNEQRDSLRSKATLSILDLLGEGPIGGLVDGAKSVYLNDTPLQNANGTSNFQGVSWDIRGGGNSQSVMPSFGNYIESPFNLGVQVKQSTPYTFSIANSNADSVRVVISVPGLSTTNASNGDISGATVQYKLQVSTDNGATWNDQLAGYVWDQVGSWTTVGGHLTADAPSAAYAGVRASVQATCAAIEYGVVTVQPQEFNGSTWQNLGDQVNLTHSVTEQHTGNDNSASVLVGESYAVQSGYNKVRFILVAKSSANGGIAASSLYSQALAATVTISGKSQSRYQRSHVLHITPGSVNRVRMVRITPDSSSVLLQNDTYLDSYSEIVSLNMEYPNSALFGLRVDSQQFGGSIPSRSYLLDGLYIRVPTNYDPVTRTYTGVWNGTFKYAISNNPAWVLFDVLTNKRYGLGNFIEDSQVDKTTLYTIGKYCDEAVPNGFGGTEPRFTLNAVVSNLGEAYKLISDIASTFRGMSFWDGGMVNFTQDSPADPTMLYTAANVINGEFTYSGSARKDRHSIVQVTWNDPSDNYKQRVEYVEDAELVELYGVRKLDTLAFGCTSRGQATRVGKWILYTGRYESDLVTFKVGLDSAFVMPGNIVKIHDTSRAGRRAAGRLTACTTTGATLDSPISVRTGSTISIMMPDGSFADRQLVRLSPLPTFAVTWLSPLSELPVSNAIWMLSESNLVPVLARVIGVTQGEHPGEFDITALEHNPTKFNAIEYGWELEERNTSIIDAAFVQTPTRLYATEARYRAAPGVFANKLLIFWYGDCTEYEVSYRGTGATNGGNWVVVRVTDGLSYEVPNISVGSYQISVVGINPLGRRSASATGTYTVVGKTASPSDVTQFFATPNERGVELSWVAIPDEDVRSYEVRKCSTAGQSWGAATKLVETPLTVYQVPPSIAGSYEWLVKAIDTSGNYSVNAKRVAVTLAPPGVVTPTCSYSRADVVVTWNAATAGSLPVHHYVIKRGATWATAVDVGTTTDLSYRVGVSWTTTQLIWVVAADTAGNIGSPRSVSIAFAKPSAPSVSSSQRGASFVIEWSTPPSSLPISAYEVRYGSTFASGISVGVISGNQLAVPITWLGSRTFWVAAIDLNGNVGTAGSRSLGVTAPRAPTGFSVTYNQNQITISWGAATETLPIDFYEVRRGADWTTGELVEKAYTNAVTLSVSWRESATFTIRATDINGNNGAIATYVNGVAGPGTVSVAHQLRDGNAILSWAAPVGGSLPIHHYEIRTGATWETASVVGVTSDRLYSVPMNWTSSKTFFVAAVDAANNFGVSGSRTIGFQRYGAPTRLSGRVSQSSLTLTWERATGGSLNVDYYDIRHGGDWDTGEVIGRASTTTITLPIAWVGSRKFWVTAVDTNGQYGVSSSYTSTVNSPAAPSVSSTIVVAKAELTWTAPYSTLPIKEYEIRYGASWDTGAVVATTLANSYRVPIDWLGDRTFWVAARNVNNNVGAADSTVVTIAVPNAPDVSGSFLLDEFKLTWISPSSTLPIAEYEVRHGASWSAGTVLGRVKGTTISTKAQWVGVRTWWVAAIDVNDNVGTPDSTTLTITAPSRPVLTQQVVDNNVLLYWTQAAGTLPIVTNELRRGATWATAEAIGQKAGGFTTIFETASGAYTYWVAGVDSAGNVGTAGRVVANVSQPPDYALKANNDLTFAGTKSNMALDTDGSYVLPVNTTETFEQHFTSHSWTNPDGQISAGYPIFIQPASSSGYYEETIDYGTAIGGTKITVTPTGTAISGVPDTAIDISVKLNSGDAWISYPNTSSVFVNNFRYAKIRFTVTGGGTSLYRLTRLNVKLDVKIRNEGGMGTASATDAVSGTNAIVNGVSLTGANPVNSYGNRVPDGIGTMIRFGTAFVDITSIEVSLASGSTARYALYDFVDTPNAAGFKVLLYDASGSRVGGSFSWSVRGY
jgi:predicted phage tail protein